MIYIKDLKGKRLIKWAERRNIDLYLDMETNILTMWLVDQTDSFVTYKYSDEKGELFYDSFYQIEGLEDLPHWIHSVEQIKELIEYIGKEGK